ncbi:MAG: LCCL domain-containing protein [Pyrinomonadaceae bacterium]
MRHTNKFVIAMLASVMVSLLAVTGFAQETINWATQADTLRGRNGQQFTFVCPAGGPISSRLWGTDVYTDDSSICTAAVHAGYIELPSGGAVTIEIRPGQSGYTGVTRNGIVSRGYGSWSGSFVFVGRISGSANVNWAAQADSLRGRNGQRFTYSCPPGGPPSGRVWGTDLYTDDSSICTAAVHAGAISIAAGGSVTIEIRPAASTYRGTLRNGIASKSYGAYGGSFLIVSAPTRQHSDLITTTEQSATWNATAESYRGRHGQRFTYACPANGFITFDPLTGNAEVWGTNLYTDDSTVCVAAVHAGLININRGGKVTIEIQPGAASYQGTTRNEVNTRNYGPSKGSFVFVQ